MVRIGAVGRRMVEVKDLLDGSCAERVSVKTVEELMKAGLPTCRSRNECCWEAMVVGARQESTGRIRIVPVFLQAVNLARAGSLVALKCC